MSEKDEILNALANVYNFVNETGGGEWPLNIFVGDDKMLSVSLVDRPPATRRMGP